MGNRLSRIYTRTGDSGETGLGDGSRVPKDDPRIEAIGAVDELNSAIGWLLAQALPGPLQETLTGVQHRLFDLGGELSLPGRTLMQAERVTELEQCLDRLNETLPPLKDFILPGGGTAAALAHLARALCRRAERRVYTLSRSAPLSPIPLKYLNRLSDLLFVMARYSNARQGHADVLWRKGD